MRHWKSVEEVRRSLLTALIDRKITKYITTMNGIVKKLEKDKYFIAIKLCYIAELKEKPFFPFWKKLRPSILAMKCRLH